MATWKDNLGMALDFEKQFYNDKVKLIVGCDEAGRGCLLGDVFAGAVILPSDFQCDLINRSHHRFTRGV